MVVTIGAIVYLVRYIIENGSDFVDWPSLVPLDYRFYRGPETMPYKISKQHSDSEYGEKIELQKIE